MVVDIKGGQHMIICVDEGTIVSEGHSYWIGIENGTITSSMDLYRIPELEEVDFDFELSDDGPDQL